MVGIPTYIARDIATQIINCNKWLDITYLRIDELYILTSSVMNLYNCIITIDIEAHQHCIAQEHLDFSGKKCKVYNYTGTSPCLRCQSLHHGKAGCTNQLMCKICAGSHHHRKCNSHGTDAACINCIRSNNNGTAYPTNHRASYEGCYTKKHIDQQNKYS